LHAELIIITGRSLSWGHFFLTHFPFTHCIAEGGGVILSRQKTGIEFEEECLASAADIDALEVFEKQMRKDLLFCPFSSDSFGRKTDRAVDLHHLDEEQKDKIHHYLQHHQINYSDSNVHINFWKGDISKSKAMEHFLKTRHPHLSKEDCLYFGDAKNDQSVFKEFPHTVGVSNINRYLHQMDHHPRTILQGDENYGVDGVLAYLRAL